MWTDTAKDFFRYCPTCGAKMENVTSVDGKHFDKRDGFTTNSCTECPMFSNENGIRKCGNTEISGFIAKPDQNPILNWCPLGSKNNEP